MAYLAPSILSADFMNLGRDIQTLKQSGASWVHVDVMDGVFVPNISFGMPIVKAIRPTTDLTLDVHMMVTQPIRYVETFCDLGADYLTIHIEADTPENTLEALKMIRAKGVSPSISLKPGTPAEAVKPYLELVDMILVMTVEPGFGGQSFMEDMMPKLKTLRTWLDEVNPNCLLEVDGGVDSVTGPICQRSGAQVLVAGSAYFRAEDKAEFVRILQSPAL